MTIPVSAEVLGPILDRRYWPDTPGETFRECLARWDAEYNANAGPLRAPFVRLCGSPSPLDAEMVDPEVDVSCVVCHDLETNAYEWCPLDGRCIHAVEA